MAYRRGRRRSGGYGRRRGSRRRGRSMRVVRPLRIGYRY